MALLRYIITVGLLAVGLGSGTAIAQETESDGLQLGTLACDPAPDFNEPTRYLRALSLDLRGTLPSADEIDQVRVMGSVPEALIDEWLASDAFAEQAVRFHRKLLWNNVETINLFAATFRFTRTADVYWRRNTAINYRGTESIAIPCRDEPAEFGPNGEILTDANNVEGYVMVDPYWSEDSSPIKVCAFDAQNNLYSDTGTDCSTRVGANDAGCGCGPALRWCTFGNESRRVTRSMGEALEQLLFSLFQADRPYTEIFTTRKGFINGPLSYFWRNQTGTPAGLVYEPKPLNEETLPVLPFIEEDVWREVELPEAHAGVLTRPAFLLRFQTNRARANRFYDSFLCQPFNPPEGGLPVADEESARNPDLQHRAGCKYCHSILEPAAAHWGRWTEQGIGYLDATSFPATRDDCEACATRGQNCNAECRNFYATQSFSEIEDDYLGMLNAYKFRREDHIRNIEVGPKLLALAAVADNRLPTCVSKRTASWLLGSETLDDSDASWVQELSRQFVFSDMSFRALVKAIVMSPRYRRVR